MNKYELMDILPHREPMLLLDRVDLVDGDSVGRYIVKGDEFFLRGHFPQNPVVPGVILCEMMAQSACLLIAAGPGDPFTPYLTGLNNVKFRRKVVPGDALVFRCRLVRQKDFFYVIDGTGHVGDDLCVSGELSFAIVKGNAE